jgi:hypothetical protein
MIKLKNVVIASLFSFIGTNAHAILIDFDNLPGGGTTVSGQSLTNEYASLGVNFFGFEEGAPLNNTVGLDSTLSNPMGNALSNSSPFLGSRHDILRIVFDTPASNLSWLTRRSLLAPTFFFYDASDVLLGSLISEAGICCTLVNTVASFSGVSRIDAVQPSDTWSWAMDNLSFDLGPSSAVPTPTTLALFGLGLAGLGWSNRKKA